MLCHFLGRPHTTYKRDLDRTVLSTNPKNKMRQTLRYWRTLLDGGEANRHYPREFRISVRFRQPG